MTDPPSVRS